MSGQGHRMVTLNYDALSMSLRFDRPQNCVNSYGARKHIVYKALFVELCPFFKNIVNTSTQNP